MALHIKLPDEAIFHAARRARFFALEMKGEVPVRLHADQIAPDGAPALAPEFVRWLDAKGHPSADGDDPRLRATKAFRLLRKKAPSEYHVVWNICVIDQVGVELRYGDDETLRRHFENAVTRATIRMNRLNDRVGRPRYSESEVELLAESGLRKLALWAG